MVYCDVSITGLGAVLMHQGHLIVYTSRQIRVGGSGVCPQYLATIPLWGLLYYLYRSQGLEVFDGSSKFEHEADQIIESGEDYDCEIIYYPGKANVVVDALNRKAVAAPIKELYFEDESDHPAVRAN